MFRAEPASLRIIGPARAYRNPGQKTAPVSEGERPSPAHTAITPSRDRSMAGWEPARDSTQFPTLDLACSCRGPTLQGLGRHTLSFGTIRRPAIQKGDLLTLT